MKPTRALAVLASAVALVSYSTAARSADHGDSPATKAEPAADINDVYAWMADANHVVLAMTLFPNAPAGTMFSNAVDYVFHTGAAPSFGTALPTSTTDVIATFDATQKISLWVGTSEFLTGDASSTSGLSSADGKVKVFAGLRADPFFFNFPGFVQTVATVESAAPSLMFNDAGCPMVSPATSAALATELKTSTLDGGAPVNPFATWNALAIVVQIDKSLLTTSANQYLTVWGATYKAQ